MARTYDQVSDFLEDLDPSARLIVEEVRRVIMQTRPDLDEHIKWNSPSYVLAGVDRLTFNTKNKQGVVQLVLHMGPARRESRGRSPLLVQDEGLVQWVSDIRGIIAFPDLDAIASRSVAVTSVINRWLEVSPIEDES